MNLKERATQLKTDIPAVFLSLKSPETPWHAKALAALALVYALSPIDLIPDFIPKDTFERYRQEAQGMWQDGKPKKWFYAIPFIIIWMLCAWLIARKYFPAG